MILVIWASPNNDGLTASAKDMFVSGIQKTAAESAMTDILKKYYKIFKMSGQQESASFPTTSRVFTRK